MIQASRLQELIEQGATIYYVDKADNMTGKIDLSEYEVKIVDNYFLIKTRIKPDFSNYFGYEPDWHYDFRIYLSYTFETEEDAEFALRYKRIPRTEYLDLPTWEEFNSEDKTITFYKNQAKYQMYIFVKNKNTNNCRIIIYADDNSQDWLVFEKPLAKENYLEACEVARKLWLGKKV